MTDCDSALDLDAVHSAASVKLQLSASRAPVILRVLPAMPWCMTASLETRSLSQTDPGRNPGPIMAGGRYAAERRKVNVKSRPRPLTHPSAIKLPTESPIPSSASGPAPSRLTLSGLVGSLL